MLRGSVGAFEGALEILFLPLSVVARPLFLLPACAVVRVLFCLHEPSMKFGLTVPPSLFPGGAVVCVPFRARDVEGLLADPPFVLAEGVVVYLPFCLGILDSDTSLAGAPILALGDIVVSVPFCSEELDLDIVVAGAPFLVL
jgi:hypothetical protein